MGLHAVAGDAVVALARQRAHGAMGYTNQCGVEMDSGAMRRAEGAGLRDCG